MYCYLLLFLLFIIVRNDDQAVEDSFVTICIICYIFLFVNIFCCYVLSANGDQAHIIIVLLYLFICQCSLSLFIMYGFLFIFLLSVIIVFLLYYIVCSGDQVQVSFLSFFMASHHKYNYLYHYLY